MSSKDPIFVMDVSDLNSFCNSMNVSCNDSFNTNDMSIASSYVAGGETPYRIKDELIESTAIDENAPIVGSLELCGAFDDLPVVGHAVYLIDEDI